VIEALGQTTGALGGSAEREDEQGDGERECRPQGERAQRSAAGYDAQELRDHRRPRRQSSQRA